MAEIYSLQAYGKMIEDTARFGAYVEAIAEVVRPGDTVVDLGSGPGVMALLACRAGARRVYAIEMSDTIEVGRQLAAANGFADRIVFLHGDSRKLELPERARVVVSDLRGTLPLFGSALASLEDARQRFLEPGGILIPQKDTLLASLVEAPETYAGLAEPWEHGIRGADLTAARELSVNTMSELKAEAAQIVAGPEPWAVLDYQENLGRSIRGSIRFRVARPATVHGIGLWFDAFLRGTLSFTSGPVGPSAPPKPFSNVYGQSLLPWVRPLALAAGQEVSVALSADLVDSEYVWRWETNIAPANAMPAIHSVQSTFFGQVYSKERLRRRARDFVPSLSAEGEADRWILSSIDGCHSHESIACSAAKKFPGRFSSEEEALEHVILLTEKYDRD
jgi:type I protein arginine methyltransferase